MIEGLYIHIPFCDKICTYCDFAKIFYKTANRLSYLNALKTEYHMYKAAYDVGNIKTIYFGGGTPSALNIEELTALMETFSPLMMKAQEVTFEANPESLTLEKLHVLKENGVNRISMGVQTFDEKQLQFLGRNHASSDISAAVSAIRAAGIQNFNVDLIYALPKQTLEHLMFDVEQLLTLDPTHISAYALIVEPHTALYLQVEADEVNEVDESIQATMYNFLRETLAQHGYIQYETSNWAKKPEYTSKHNLSYWTGKQYIGLGLGSHGYVQQERYENTRAITKYINFLEENKLPVTMKTHVSEKEQMEEMLFLGLRVITGVSKQEFLMRFNKDIHTVFGAVIKKHSLVGNLEETPTHICLTHKAVFISNEVLSDFLLEDE